MKQKVPEAKQDLMTVDPFMFAVAWPAMSLLQCLHTAAHAPALAWRTMQAVRMALPGQRAPLHTCTPPSSASPKPPMPSCLAAAQIKEYDNAADGALEGSAGWNNLSPEVGMLAARERLQGVCQRRQRRASVWRQRVRASHASGPEQSVSPLHRLC